MKKELERKEKKLLEKENIICQRPYNLYNPSAKYVVLLSLPFSDPTIYSGPTEVGQSRWAAYSYPGEVSGQEFGKSAGRRRQLKQCALMKSVIL